MTSAVNSEMLLLILKVAVYFKCYREMPWTSNFAGNSKKLPCTVNVALNFKLSYRSL